MRFPLMLLLALALPARAEQPAFRDVLDTPARASKLADRTPYSGVVHAGARLVAVGQRGHIIYSDDQGKAWRQANVPLSSDLLALSFPTPQQGWAVGHDGVILHSADGGANWTRQLDGRALGTLLATYYRDAAAQGLLGAPEQAAVLLDEVAHLAKQGAENSFLDVWFSDAQTGYAVGAFNLIVRTIDGGKSWEPWLHRTDNPRRMHLYAVREVGGTLYVGGEQGLAMRLDGAAARFTAFDTGYAGSYFGISGTADAVLLFGLRGSAYRSTDGKQWSRVETGVQEGLVGAAACGARQLVLVSQSGRLLASDDAGAHFRPVKLERSTPAAGVACDRRGLAIAGARGVTVLASPFN